MKLFHSYEKMPSFCKATNREIQYEMPHANLGNYKNDFSKDEGNRRVD